MVRLLRHRQTKGAATARQNLRLPRHISTLPNFPVRNSARAWHITDFERQVSAQTRTYRLILNKVFLNDKEP
jgi:hypothetical protein